MQEEKTLLRFKQIRHLLNLTQKEFSEKLGVKWHTIRDIERGKQKISAELAVAIEEKFSVSMRWLLTGKGEMFLNESKMPRQLTFFSEKQIKKSETSHNTCPYTDKENPPTICEHGFAHIPLVEAELSAGGGSFITSNNIVSYLAFKLDWIRKKYINPEKAVLMRVRGDSMTPVIHNGDVVLIDMQNTKPKDGKIYAIAFEDSILIKEIQLMPPDTILLISKNPEYKEIILKTSDISKLNIIGQVKWIGKELD